MEISLAIVGTAGRDDDADRLSKEHFKAMCIIASGLIDQLGENNYPITHLVSGGAAWADHVAVKLFLEKKTPHLRLFLPAAFEGGSFTSGKPNKVPYPGGAATQDVASVANNYHHQFQRTTGINSLTEIALAKAEGAELIPIIRKGYDAFFARNALVAKSDFLLAMTFGDGPMVKDGGTADTVRKYLERVKKEGFFDKSFHFDLNTKQIYEGRQAPKKQEVSESFKKTFKKLPVKKSKGSKLIGAHSYP